MPEIETAPSNEEDLRRKLDEERRSFDAERNQWRAEKERVLAYQARLQQDYVEANTLIGALDDELRRLRAELHRARRGPSSSGDGGSEKLNGEHRGERPLEIVLQNGGDAGTSGFGHVTYPTGKVVLRNGTGVDESFCG